MSSKTQQKLLIIKKEDILYVNMSKTASASEEPNLFELFRAPKVFEAKPQRAPPNPVSVRWRCKGRNKKKPDTPKKTCREQFSE